MIIATETGAIHADHESITEFDRVIRELTRLFTLNQWQWSGSVPTVRDMEWQLNQIVHTAVESANASADGYARISGGRLFVEARRGGTGEGASDPRYALSIGVQIHLA